MVGERGFTGDFVDGDDALSVIVGNEQLQAC